MTEREEFERTGKSVMYTPKRGSLAFDPEYVQLLESKIKALQDEVEGQASVVERLDKMNDKLAERNGELILENMGLKAQVKNFKFDRDNLKKRLSEAPELTLEVVAGDDDEWILEEIYSQNPIYRFLSDDKRFVKAIPYKPMRFALVELTDSELKEESRPKNPKCKCDCHDRYDFWRTCCEGGGRKKRRF